MKTITLLSLFVLSLTVSAKDAAKKSTPPQAAETKVEAVTPAAPTVAAGPAVTFEGVQLAPTSLVNSTELKAVSHGLRKVKAFGLIPVDVYVVEFYALSPEKIQKTDDQILNSLPTAGPVQIKLTLKRDLSGSDISNSFTKALKENDVDLSKPVTGLSELMKEIETLKEVKKGEVFALSGDWSNNQYQIQIQKPDASTKTIAADDMALKKLFSIWLGKPVDDKMNDLKKNLLK